MYLINSPGSTDFRDRHPGPISNALTYYELGLAIELMFFLTALALKNKTNIVVRTKEGERLKLKTEMQDFENNWQYYQPNKMNATAFLLTCMMTWAVVLLTYV